MNKNEMFKCLTEEYSLKLVSNLEEMERVKHIRESVYTKKYLKSKEFLDSIGVIENDEDKQSFIYLLRDNTAKMYVGTVRIFFINDASPIRSLPMELTVNRDKIEKYLHSNPIMEISRLALLKNIPISNFDSALQLRITLSYGLMVATRISFILYRCSVVLAIMEKSLFRILKRQNINFQQIADSVDSFGVSRVPHAIERKKLLLETEETMGDITRFYLKQLCNNPDKLWEFVGNNLYLERSGIQLDRICKLFEEYGDDVDVNLLIGEDLVK